MSLLWYWFLNNCLMKGLKNLWWIFVWLVGVYYFRVNWRCVVIFGNLFGFVLFDFWSKMLIFRFCKSCEILLSYWKREISFGFCVKNLRLWVLMFVNVGWNGEFCLNLLSFCICFVIIGLRWFLEWYMMWCIFFDFLVMKNI